MAKSMHFTIICKMYGMKLNPQGVVDIKEFTESQ